MRTEIAIISALALVLSMPLVFAQVDSSNATSATGTSATGTSATELEPFVFVNQPYTKPTNLTSEGVGFYEVRNPDGTFTLTSHYPYFETESGEFLPYRLNQDSSMIQVEVNGGKFVFDKTNGSVTIFDEDEIVVSSDSYVVKSALEGTDVWNNLSTNDESVNITVLEKGETLEILLEKENDLGLFRTVNTIYAGELKTDLYFINNGLKNSKISFTETLELPNNTITLNEQVIDLNQFVGQSFDRSTLEQNEDLVLEAKEILYNAGLGFEYLWQVNIHEDNKISLDYANSETVYNVGDVTWLDPTWNVTGTINTPNADFNISSLPNNSIISSGDIDGTNLTSTQLTSVQNAHNSGTTTWSQPYTAGSNWTPTNHSVTSGNPATMTLTGASGNIKSVNTGNNGSIKLSNQSFSGYIDSSVGIKDYGTNKYYYIQYPYSSFVHSNLSGSQVNHGNIGSAGSTVYEVQVSGSNVYLKQNGSTFRSGTTTSTNFTALYGSWGTNGVFPSTYTVELTGGFNNASNPVLTLNYSTATVPTAPQNLLVQFNSPNVDLQFTTPSSDGGSAITGYSIEHSTDGSNYSVLVNDTGNTNTTYSHGSPTMGSTNYYKVYAINSIGLSVASNVDSVLAGTPPDPPTNLTSVIQDVNTNPLNVVLNWSSPSNVGTGILSGFEVYRNGSLITTTGLVTTYTDTVTAGSHSYYLKAVSNHGTSVVSNTSNVTTPSVPDAPATLTTQILDPNVSPYDVTLNWTAPTSDGGSSLVSYNIYRAQGSGSYSLVGTTTSTTLTLLDTVPNSANTNFTYHVHAVNNVGEGTFKDSTITTPSAPNAPTLSVIPTSTALSWVAPTSQSTITGYEIHRGGSLLDTVAGDVLEYVDHSPITFGTQYDYGVKAVSLVGTGGFSNVVTTTPSIDVTDLATSGVTGTGVVLYWSEPPYYQGTLTDYTILYSTPHAAQPITALIANTGSTTSQYTIGNLQYLTDYSFVVLANSSLGNSQSGNVVDITTLEDLSITSFQTGSFDIDATNPNQLDQIKFDRSDAGSGSLQVTTLTVEYPVHYNLSCTFDYKFANTVDTYSNLTTTQLNADLKQTYFTLNGVENEIIMVVCTDVITGDSAEYLLTQNNFPLLEQVSSFRNGEFGTAGNFGVLDIVTLFVIVISMVAFNRINQIVGVVLSTSLLFALAWFGIIEIPSVFLGIIAVIVMLVIGAHRKT